MALPGYDWLRVQLSRLDDLGGGYHNKMANPVLAGAGFAMSVFFVVLWIVALGPLLLWQLAGWTRRGRTPA